MKTLFLSETSVRSWLLAIVLGFVSGSVLYSKHIPRLFLHKNICENAPDQNPGASNVFISCGVGWGLFCLALDLFKAYLPVRLALHTLDTSSLWFAPSWQHRWPDTRAAFLTAFTAENALPRLSA